MVTVLVILRMVVGNRQYVCAEQLVQNQIELFQYFLMPMFHLIAESWLWVDVSFEEMEVEEVAEHVLGHIRGSSRARYGRSLFHPALLVSLVVNSK